MNNKMPEKNFLKTAKDKVVEVSKVAVEYARNVFKGVIEMTLEDFKNLVKISPKDRIEQKKTIEQESDPKTAEEVPDAKSLFTF